MVVGISWEDKANCATVGSELMYTEENNEAVRVARDVCHRCPVKAACRIASLPERYGVWASRAATPRASERRAIGYTPAFGDTDVPRFRAAAQRGFLTGQYIQALAPLIGMQGAVKWLRGYV